MLLKSDEREEKDIEEYLEEQYGLDLSDLAEVFFNFTGEVQALPADQAFEAAVVFLELGLNIKACREDLPT